MCRCWIHRLRHAIAIYHTIAPCKLREELDNSVPLFSNILRSSIARLNIEGVCKGGIVANVELDNGANCCSTALLTLLAATA